MTVPTLIQHQLMTHRGRVKRKLGKPPRWMYPRIVEVAYRKYLLAMLDKMREEFKRVVVPKLPAFVGQAAPIKMDSWASDLDDTMGEYEEGIEALYPDRSAMAYLERLGQQTGEENHKQWYKICKKVLGVDLYTNMPSMVPRMESFVHDNVTLIKDVRDQVYKNIRLSVAAGIREGKRAGSIADDILSTTDLPPGRFRVAETRAAFIARDQVGKLNGDITGMRQQSAGLDEYTWQTSEDERVVGTPGGRFPHATAGHGNHFAFDGMLCKWSNPNIYSRDGGKTWIPRPENMRGAIPGSQYSCRCSAEGNFSKLLAGTASLKQDGGEGSGNFGHQGRPGMIGGSGEGGAEQTKAREVYEKVMKFDSPDGREMLARYGVTASQVREKVNEARIQNRKMGSSDMIHKNENGRYSPERRELHKKIVKEYLSRAQPAAAGESPVLFLTGGISGSGKSTMLNSPTYAHRKGSATVDSDDIKQALAVHDGHKNVGPFANYYHEESSHISNLILVVARRQRLNIGFDATMKSGPKFERLTNDFIKKGYKVEIAYAKLPLEKAMVRATSRFLHGDRFVDPKYAATQNGHNLATLNALKNKPGVSYKEWDMDVPRGSPAILISASKNNY